MYLFIINEASSSERRFKCPFCDFRGTREDLVTHVEEEHDELIPEEQTAAQVVFNKINNKEHGSCSICKKPTAWNETVWRYDRYCEINNGRCRQIAGETARNNMIGAYGKVTLLNDMEHQKKMLAGRAISGTYTFADGGVHSYTGSYEHKRLEFTDKVMETHSKDWMIPGPIFEYTFDGKKLQWITDALYIPFNLVIDDKAGGANPNTHGDQEEYRQKQVAKEKAIKDAGTHNYLRLTDTDFSQLIEAMMEIKRRMVSSDEVLMKEKIILINEAQGELLNLKSARSNDVLLMAYGSEYIIEGVAYCDSLLMDKFIVPDMENNKLVSVGRKFFNEKSCHLFKLENTEKSLYESLLNTVVGRNPNDPIITPTMIPSLFLQEDISIDDIFDDERLYQMCGFNDISKYDIHSILKEMAIVYRNDEIVKEMQDANFGIKFTALNEGFIDLKKYKNLIAMEDTDGKYVYNLNTKKRTVYVKSFKDLTPFDLHLVGGN